MPPSAGAQRDEESGDGSTAGPAQNPDGASGTAQAATATTQTRVLTPATIRLDSKVLFAHTSALWTANCVFCVLLIYKLGQPGSKVYNASWWAVFSPQFAGHGCHILLLLWAHLTREQRLLQQLGPPPPQRASPSLHNQFRVLRSMAVRSHIVDTLNAFLDTSALLAVKIIFAQMLVVNMLDRTPLCTVFIPIWVVWPLTWATMCFKHRKERTFGSQRDLLYAFLLMVALKVDGLLGFSWMSVFIIPWIWLCGMFILAVIVVISLTCSRGWSRWRELLMPIGFMLMLFSASVPQFVFCRNLVSKLGGSTRVSYQDILIPAAVSWALMWLSSGLLAVGLRTRERIREQLLASGAVWTAHEALARRLQTAGERESEQQRLDAMSEEELVKLAAQHMAERGLVPPSQLQRVGATLFRPLATPGSQPISTHTDTDTIPAEPPAKAGTLELKRMSPAPQGAAEGPATADAAATGADSAAAAARAGTSGRVSAAEDAAWPGLLGGRAGGELGALLGLGGGGGGGGVEAGLPQIRGGEDADDGMCVICYDKQATCVLLECGHGGFCRRCAHLLLVRPPCVCPTCRQQIDMVVTLQDIPRVGEVAAVMPVGDQQSLTQDTGQSLMQIR